MGLALIWLVALLAACGTTGGAPEDGVQGAAVPASAAETPAAEREAPASEEREAPSAFPTVVTDGAGLEVAIEREPQTIVTLIPSLTETAFALGLGDKIVGVSNHCNFPEEALTKERLGGREIDAEKLLALSPDIAFVTNHHHATYPELLDTFREAGIQVVVIQSSANSFEDVYRSIRIIGAATGTADDAETLIQGMEAKKEEIERKAALVDEPKRVWIEVFPGLHTTGANTFMHEMLETINAVNVAMEQTGWVQLNEEEAVALAPEVIITTYGEADGQAAEEVLRRPGWGEVPAVVERQVFDVDNDRVVRPGPHMMDGVEILARTVYPEVFD